MDRDHRSGDLGRDGKEYDEADNPQLIVTYSMPLTGVSNSPVPNTVSDTATHTVAFTTVDALPSDGKIVVRNAENRKWRRRLLS